MFEIKYSRQAIKFIKFLDKKLALRILSKIGKEQNPPFGRIFLSILSYRLYTIKK